MPALPFDEALSRYPNMSMAVAQAIGSFAFFKKDIVSCYEQYGKEYLEFGERVSKIALMHSDSGNLDRAVKAFIKFSFEYLKLQKELGNIGSYHYRKFEDAKSNVYDKAEVMEGYYLDALLLSSFLWRNHYRIFDFFLHKYLPCLEKAGTNLEIGIGHGLFSALLLEQKQDWYSKGIDISIYSLEYAARTLSFECIDSSRFSLSPGDAINIHEGPEKYDSVICGEVLEHVECPEKVLNEIRNVMKPDAVCFLTTAAYAASLDHIYLFESVDDIRNMIFKSGFRICSEELIRIGGGEFEEGLVKCPVDYGAIMKKC